MFTAFLRLIFPLLLTLHLLPLTLSSAVSRPSPVRMNGKNLNRFFSRLASAWLVNKHTDPKGVKYTLAPSTSLVTPIDRLLYIATTIDDHLDDKSQDLVSRHNVTANSIVEDTSDDNQLYTVITDNHTPKSNHYNSTKYLQLGVESTTNLTESSEETLTITTTPTPTTTLGHRWLEESTPPPPPSTFTPQVITRGTITIDYIKRPDMCKCVCNEDEHLIPYDVSLTEFKRRLDYRTPMNVTNNAAASTTLNKTVAVKNNTNNVQVVDMLDSLVADVDQDYDDIDEVEKLQRPENYLPLEVIELSHRRPPRNKSTTTTTTHSPFNLLSIPPPSFASSSSSSSSPSSPSSSSSSPSSPPSSSSPNSAPLYSVSFQKPVTVLKSFLSRMAQISVPLFLTAALGNALSNIEMLDRSDRNRKNASSLVNPLDHWPIITLPVVESPDESKPSGQYPPQAYFDYFQSSPSNFQRTSSLSWMSTQLKRLFSNSGRRLGKSLMDEDATKNEDEWREVLDILHRWLKRLS